MRDVWLAFKLHRFEIVSVVVLSVGLAVAALVVTSMLAGGLGPAHCVTGIPFEVTPPECVGTEDKLRINEDYAGKIMAAMGALPFIAGTLLGVSLVAREIEQHTASLSWSLSGRRRRWFLRRFVPVAVLMAAALSIPALATSLLEAARPFGGSPDVSFNDYALRGPLVAFRGMVAFGMAVLAGAVVGRVLPAVIMAGVGGFIVYTALLIALPFGQPIEVLPFRDLSDPFASGVRDLHVWTGQAVVYTGDPSTSTPEYGVSGKHLREVEAREAGVLLLGFVLLAGVSLAVVDRRRPY